MQHSDESIKEFIESCDPIELYCVYQPEGRNGLMYSFNVKEGIFYNFLIRDNEFNQACVNYLKRQGLPFFQYIGDLNEYEKELQERYKSCLENHREGAVVSETA
jgi:hypothetical protein